MCGGKNGRHAFWRQRHFIIIIIIIILLLEVCAPRQANKHVYVHISSLSHAHARA